MIGLFVGIVAGSLQFWLLSKFTMAITSGSFSTKNVLLGMLQFFTPMGVLLCMALIRRSDLMWTAIGIVGTLIICAIIKFVVNTIKTRGREDNNV